MTMNLGVESRAGTLARLHALIALGRAQIRANPEPYLERAYDELLAVRRTLEEIDRALSTDAVVDYAAEIHVKPTDIRGEAVICCAKARRILDQYFFGIATSITPSGGKS